MRVSRPSRTPSLRFSVPRAPSAVVAVETLVGLAVRMVWVLVRVRVLVQVRVLVRVLVRH